MCGLTGFFGPAAPPDELRALGRAMSDSIAHRGPDDSGEWSDAAAGIEIAFRRLAIIDLTEAGHQPMTSASGRYVIAYNGEVYNFERIRAELREQGFAPQFRGHSDTEVMLAAIELWGLEAAVKRFIGMFAIALWDRRERRLHLIRDRFGVKPMYYGFSGRSFLFGSELKALRQHPDFDDTIDRGALALYMRYLYVPGPYTIYKAYRKLEPGTILTIDAPHAQPSITRYWSVREVAERGAANPFLGTQDEAADQLDALLRDAIGLRMISDVPLGVFLSGGIDSSVVTALMQAQSSQPVRTFTIGFNERVYDEARHAAAIAKHLGTAHTEMYVTPRDAMDVIPKLPSMYDEPFADSSQIPTHLVSAMARRHVTVTLSGDGGDELFGGYARYFLGQQFLNKVRRVPRPMRRVVGRSLLKVGTHTWDRLAAVADPFRLTRFRTRTGQRIHKIARSLVTGDADQTYFELVWHWDDIVLGADRPYVAMTDRATWPALDDPIQRMMYFDQISYLVDDILVKVDRASMAVSLESREPLLDHRLAEFAWTLPLSMKVHGSVGKHLLRRVLYRYVPQSLIDRPKMGFGIPIDSWLRGPLRDWAESLLDERRLRDEGLLDPQPVRKRWADFVAGNGEWHYYIWVILMFEAWMDETRPGAACPQETGAHAAGWSA
jgi:asparagine synthase (glutamine-hydrolysing)